MNFKFFDLQNLIIFKVKVSSSFPPACVKVFREGVYKFFSPYFKKIFADESKTFVLYCQSAWRSVLATKTLMDMGMTNVKQFEDGFGGWKKAGGPVAQKEKK
jgi:rhodanese-related sulfurtransferase